ncbi:MAG: prepilin-type N-terminal cleavage/methylation domain-containing protein [Armatimonadetes bacterium]|nr:prepilin-type N-terminal cleavage/methylation domain-containing protein [Armatimonadota bacterium]
MRTMGNRRGFTMLEVMMSLSIMTMVLVATVSMMIATMRCYQSESAKVDTDTSAVMAMQDIVNKVREAKTVDILNTQNNIIPSTNLTTDGVRLNIKPPITVQDKDYYDRSQIDTVNTTDYYISDATGETGRTGTYLWRDDKDGKRIIKNNVSSLLLRWDTSRSIKITVTTKEQITNQNKPYVETQLTQRVVYLRNY